MSANKDKQALVEKRLTYVALSGTFWAIFAVFNLFRKDKALTEALSWGGASPRKQAGL